LTIEVIPSQDGPLTGTRSSKKRKLDDTDLMPSQVMNARTTKRKTIDNEGNIQEVTK
jgi:hypothetical protein